VRRDIACAFAVDRAVFEDRGCSAKNVVDVTFDVTVFKQVTTAIYKQRILPAKKATILKCRALGVDKQSDGLGTRAVRIFKRHVLSAEVVGVYESGKREPRIACLLRTQPVGDNRFLRLVTTKSYEALARAYAHLLVVYAGFDLNHDGSVVVFGNVIDGLLNIRKIA